MGGKSAVKKQAGPFGARNPTNFIANKRLLAMYWAKAVRKGNYQLVKHIFEDSKKQFTL